MVVMMVAQRELLLDAQSGDLRVAVKEVDWAVMLAVPQVELKVE